MHRFTGGMATALQALGLPPYTPVEPWLHSHPTRVGKVLTAFQRAGCTHSLTPTFMAASEPHSLAKTVATAVDHVRAAGLIPWGSTGPVAERTATYAQMATCLIDQGVRDLTLETFTDDQAALTAVQAVANVPGLRHIIVSVVPSPDGRHVRSGTALERFAVQALDAGATGVGVNCVAPDVAARSAEALAGAAPLWLFPSHVPGWAQSARCLAERATWLGGCCGVDAASLNALWSSL